MYVDGRPVKLYVVEGLRPDLIAQGTAFGRSKLHAMYAIPGKVWDEVHDFAEFRVHAMAFPTHGVIHVMPLQGLVVSGYADDMGSEIRYTESYLRPFRRYRSGLQFGISIAGGLDTLVTAVTYAKGQIGGLGFCGIITHETYFAALTDRYRTVEVLSNLVTAGGWGVVFDSDEASSVPNLVSTFNVHDVNKYRVTTRDEAKKVGRNYSWMLATGKDSGTVDGWNRPIAEPVLFLEEERIDLPRKAGHHHFASMVCFHTPDIASALVFVADTPSVGTTRGAAILMCSSTDGGRTWSHTESPTLLELFVPGYTPTEPVAEATVGNYWLIRSGANRRLQFSSLTHCAVPLSLNSALYGMSQLLPYGDTGYISAVIMLRTDDGGASFYAYDPQLPVSSGSRLYEMINLGGGVIVGRFSCNSDKPFGIDRDCFILVSTDYGVTWGYTNMPPFLNQDMGVLSAMPSGAPRGACVPVRENGEYRFYYTLNGTSWRRGPKTCKYTIDAYNGEVMRMDGGGLASDEWLVESQWSLIIDTSASCRMPGIPWAYNALLKPAITDGGTILEPDEYE